MSNTIHPEICAEMREWERRWQSASPALPCVPAPDKAVPDAERYDVYMVVLAYSYEQETEPANRKLVKQWAEAFPQYADELLAVSYARFALGLRMDDPLDEDAVTDEDAAYVDWEANPNPETLAVLVKALLASDARVAAEQEAELERFYSI